MADEDRKLGPEWGALQGYTPEEALKLVTNMHGELASENEKLRQMMEDEDDDPQPSPPQASGVDWEKIRSEDEEAAAKELRSFAERTAQEVIQREKQKELKEKFPRERERAKREARDLLAQQGGDFNSVADQLDKALTEQNGVSKEAQMNPQTWVNAYIYAMGAANISGQSTNPSEGHVERPSPRYNAPNDRRESSKYEMPEERHTHKMFERELGREIPLDEWTTFRDEINSVDDYERWVAKQKARQERR